MPSFRVLTAVLLLTAGACGTGEIVPPPGPEPIVAAPGPVDPVEPPPADPEPTLEERWRAPFAVVSSGRTAPRPERAVVVRASAPPIAEAQPVAEAVAADVEDPGSETATAAGDPAGSTPPERPLPVSTDVRTHRVEPGETWFGISRRYGVTSAALAGANPTIVPERLRAGQILRIPGSDPAVARRRTHTVGAGDSLWGISRRYGVSIESIRAANRLEGDRVRLGQVLIIPAEEPR